MPYLTDDEYKKFKELLDADNKRKEVGELRKGEALSHLIEASKLILLDLNSHYGPVEAYAIQFVKLMKRIFREENMKLYWFNWKEFKEYVTEFCLTKNIHGNTVLKKAFRERCRDYGIYTKIMRKRGVIKIWEDEPVKRVKR